MIANIRQASADDIPELKKIWTDIFGDDGLILSAFFSELYSYATIFVAEDDKQLIGSAYVLDICTLKIPNTAPVSCPYIYAVGVIPGHRHNGVGKQLTLACRDFCREKFGISCLVPAENSLFDYYEQNADYAFAFSLSEFSFEAEGAVSAEVSAIDSEKYGELREKLLDSLPHLEFNAAALRFFETLCKEGYGGLYLIKSADAYAIAACEDIDGELIIKELLCSDSNARGHAAALFWYLDYESGRYRTPENKEHPESTRSFGMLSKSISGEPFYFGPAFD
ncbi:MAG: GNAT family N-acetyltransferase [Clostridiales bacterium]|nr:GNAT family N-acetyltransferase [Clostridiales bacterium]